MRRNRQQRITDEDERELAGDVTEIPLKEFEQFVAAFVLIDAADVNGKRTADVVLLPKPVRLRIVWHVRADADDNAGNLVIAGDGMDHRAFFGGVVHHAANASKQRLEDREANRFVALGRGHEHRARRRRSGAVIRVVVPVAEEDEEVVVGGVRGDVLRQRTARGSLSVDPAELVRQRMGLVEHTIRLLGEPVGIALPLHAKPPHRHAVDRLDAGGALVAPRHVVGRARRQHFDVGVPCEVFRDVAGVELRAAIDVRSISLDDDGDFHCDSSSPSESRSESAGVAGVSDRCDSAPVNVLRSSVDSGSEAAGVSGRAAFSPFMTAAAGPRPRRPRRRLRRRLRWPGPSTAGGVGAVDGGADGALGCVARPSIGIGAGGAAGRC